MQIRFVRNFLVRHCSPQRVILLTLVSLLSSCSFLGAQVGEWCNTRAWISTDLESYVYQHFKGGQQARVGVIPFITQANLTDRYDGFRGFGSQLAFEVQQQLLATEVFPIVQMLAQEDWPGRKQEFFSGNYGSLDFAKAAGINFIVIGYVDWPARLDKWVIHSKLIDVQTGTTLWYGTSTVTTNRPDMMEVSSTLGLTDRRPDIINMTEIRNTAAQCIVHDMTTWAVEIDNG